ncbi:unnamed protein product [Chrysoparadoxa australica]
MHQCRKQGWSVIKKGRLPGAGMVCVQQRGARSGPSRPGGDYPPLPAGRGKGALQKYLKQSRESGRIRPTNMGERFNEQRGRVRRDMDSWDDEGTRPSRRGKRFEREMDGEFDPDLERQHGWEGELTEQERYGMSAEDDGLEDYQGYGEGLGEGYEDMDEEYALAPVLGEGERDDAATKEEDEMALVFGEDYLQGWPFEDEQTAKFEDSKEYQAYSEEEKQAYQHFVERERSMAADYTKMTREDLARIGDEWDYGQEYVDDLRGWMGDEESGPSAAQVKWADEDLQRHVSYAPEYADDKALKAVESEVAALSKLLEEAGDAEQAEAVVRRKLEEMEQGMAEEFGEIREEILGGVGKGEEEHDGWQMAQAEGFARGSYGLDFEDVERSREGEDDEDDESVHAFNHMISKEEDAEDEPWDKEDDLWEELCREADQYPVVTYRVEKPRAGAKEMPAPPSRPLEEIMSEVELPRLPPTLSRESAEFQALQDMWVTISKNRTMDAKMKKRMIQEMARFVEKHQSSAEVFDLLMQVPEDGGAKSQQPFDVALEEVRAKSTKSGHAR